MSNMWKNVKNCLLHSTNAKAYGLSHGIVISTQPKVTLHSSYCQRAMLKLLQRHTTSIVDFLNYSHTMQSIKSCLHLLIQKCHAEAYPETRILNKDKQWRIYIQKFPARPPQQDQILSLLHVFAKKCPCRRLALPPTRVGVPSNGKSWIHPCELEDVYGRP